MNVIVLTTGISGSSVLTGLLAKSGFWTGEETVYKDNITGKYETYENLRLVELNDQLISEMGMTFQGKARYDTNAREEFETGNGGIDIEEYESFFQECQSHEPWIWKDPRLFLTIGFWKNFLDAKKVKIIVIYRNTYELWKSQTNKRIIYSYDYLKKSESRSRADLLKYLERNELDYMLIEYDNFTKYPKEHINRLNQYLGADLSLSSWKSIYKDTSRFSKLKRTIMAFLIYAKNFRGRTK